ncbi:MAG: hypothetical protein GF347_00770, partial [Candidatus Moranbacteria bacterium]|nr:hypothetical protein [Candidatus Moranbacteria bacterium]
MLKITIIRIVKYIDFYRKFKDSPLIDLNDVETVFDGFDRRRIYEWQAKGYLKKITSNFYTFSEFIHDEDDLYFIANKIYHPSYISFESAFAYYNLIPEGVFDIFSVTTKKTRRIYAELSLQVIDFNYLSIKKSLFWGYSLI